MTLYQENLPTYIGTSIRPTRRKSLGVRGEVFASLLWCVTLALFVHNLLDLCRSVMGDGVAGR